MGIFGFSVDEVVKRINEATRVAGVKHAEKLRDLNIELGDLRLKHSRDLDDIRHHHEKEVDLINHSHRVEIDKLNLALSMHDDGNLKDRVEVLSGENRKLKEDLAELQGQKIEFDTTKRMLEKFEELPNLTKIYDRIAELKLPSVSDLAELSSALKGDEMKVVVDGQEEILKMIRYVIDRPYGGGGRF
jgi:hypothetical protein